MPQNNERWTSPTGCPPVPSAQQKARANALFHDLAPAVGVDAARLLTVRLARLQRRIDTLLERAR